MPPAASRTGRRFAPPEGELQPLQVPRVRPQMGHLTTGGRPSWTRHPDGRAIKEHMIDRMINPEKQREKQGSPQVYGRPLS